MSFAQERGRRANAGNRMRALLDQEAEMEDLFEQESLSDDEEFITKPEEDVQDIIDSDFDTESSDEELEQERLAQAEDKAIAKQEREARRVRVPTTVRPTGKRKADTTPVTPTTTTPRRPREKRTAADVKRQSSRATTIRSRLHVEEQIKQYESRKARHVKRDRPVVKQMTQEELLAEAAITERENKASLEQWLEREAEKKAKAKKKDKKRIVGPYVRYTSVTDGNQRPKRRQLFVIEPSATNSQVNVHTAITDPAVVAWHEKRDLESSEMAGRNFITFVHDDSDRMPSDQHNVLAGLTDRELDRTDLIPELAAWVDRPPRPLKPTLCPITGLPARYLDPKTNVPYANVDAFNKIRACLTHKAIWAPDMKVYVGEPAGAADVPENWKSFMAGKPEERLLNEPAPQQGQRS